jgi:MoaE-MoaD fusion protein
MSGSMRIRVLFFGVLKEVLGMSADATELPSGATIRDLLAHYEAKAPALKRWLPSLAISLNQRYASPETVLNPDDEVAFLPPVSGGSTNTPGRASANTPERPAFAAITRAPIDTQATVSNLKSGDDGAVVVFEGTVRNQTRGRKTLYLDYEAYEAMALQQMESLGGEALRKFQIRDVALIHRLGRLEIGETSVLIAVASAHRAAAFDACRWLIDTLKGTVPIWKKEHFADGAVWADGEPFPADIPRAGTEEGSASNSRQDSSAKSEGNPLHRGSPSAESASK